MDDWRVPDPSSLPPILEAALECFARGGYHGTSTRELAEAAGLSVPGLYHHYPSKQAILVDLDRFAMNSLWSRSNAALADGPQDSLSRFDRLIECLLLLHAQSATLAFVAFSEIRSLEPEFRAEHIASRDRQQSLLDEVVADGVRDGYFSTPHPRDAARAITSICMGVSQWFRPDGELDPAGVAERYGEICRQAAGYVGRASSR
ncbi:TetR/AcrR family transcriptional regulator [Brevibacterium sp.]|uniref:TetR/AcrR family transcriptional regulator n=1 Tax=Brevibacterium sp. TaxID=1701 RepID=UPI002810E907|nr:TetR/AcrR family transcriptional regulator [Brevibacterium sp.]